MKLVPHLQDLFDQINTERFESRLPKYKVIQHARLARCGRDGHLDKMFRRILLNPTLTGESQRRVLIHEMCHMEAIGHGRKWQSKMRRLAKQYGETWAAKQADYYRELSETVEPGDYFSIRIQFLEAVWHHSTPILPFWAVYRLAQETVSCFTPDPFQAHRDLQIFKQEYRAVCEWAMNKDNQFTDREEFLSNRILALAATE